MSRRWLGVESELPGLGDGRGPDVEGAGGASWRHTLRVVRPVHGSMYVHPPMLAGELPVSYTYCGLCELWLEFDHLKSTPAKALLGHEVFVHRAVGV